MEQLAMHGRVRGLPSVNNKVAVSCGVWRLEVRALMRYCAGATTLHRREAVPKNDETASLFLLPRPAKCTNPGHVELCTKRQAARGRG